MHKFENNHLIEISNKLKQKSINAQCLKGPIQSRVHFYKNRCKDVNVDKDVDVDKFNIKMLF